MKKILWISLRAPYDSVAHAGGKDHNYYLKKFHNSKMFEIRLISFCFPYEKEKLDLHKYGINNDIFVLNHGRIMRFARKLMQKIGAPASLPEYFIIRKQVKKKVRKYQKEQYIPDYIILQWTEIAMLLPFIKKVFPNSVYVSVEVDVTFLKLERKYKRAEGIKATFLKAQHNILKRQELNALEQSDLIVLNNPKDSELVITNGIDKEKTIVISPWFNNMKDIKREVQGHDLLFYGAMNRPENVEAAEWLITNVLPYVKNKFVDVRLIILGANPPKELIKKQSDSILVTGFVGDVTPYFQKSYCLVAPLQMGAGVKVKILEALSSGLPVITNHIGIEGIPATNKKEYLHCESEEEFVNAIIALLCDKDKAKEIGNNGKEFISLNYDMRKTYSIFSKRILEL